MTRGKEGNEGSDCAERKAGATELERVTEEEDEEGGAAVGGKMDEERGASTEAESETATEDAA